MAEQTGIEWCDHTWSPWTGCQTVSPACDNCYAQALDTRFGKADRWGPHGRRVRAAQSTWDRAFVWDRSAALNGIRKRVFPSMCDPFDNHPSIDLEWRRSMWFTIKATPNLTWLLLTKRPQNMVAMLPPDWGEGYPNVWLGVTAENQNEADRRVPILLRTPTQLRFLSCEPLLGPIDLYSIDVDHGLRANVLVRYSDHPFGNMLTPAAQIDWVIAGGESGLGARPSHPDWFRGLRDQCAGMDEPFFFKQWGEWAPAPDAANDTFESHKARGATNSFYWPDFTTCERVGKKRAGALLDGREHRAFPA